MLLVAWCGPAILQVHELYLPVFLKFYTEKEGKLEVVQRGNNGHRLEAFMLPTTKGRKITSRHF
jgi:hypothetical protein